MIFRMGFLAKRNAGQRLNKNIPAKAARSHPAIANIVKLVTSGCAIRIITVIIAPKEIPTAKLENNTIKLCTARIANTVLGFAPITRKMANS